MRFHSYFFSLTPRNLTSVPPPSPCFLELAFPLFMSFLLLLSLTPQTSLWTVSLFGFLLYPSILSTTLSHRIPARPFETFSHTASSARAGNFFFGMFLTLYWHFNFVTSLLVSIGYIPLSSHPTVGVAFFGTNVSERLSSREELPVSMINFTSIKWF